MTKMLGQRKPHDLPRALGDVMSDVVSGKEIADMIYERHELLTHWLVKLGVSKEIAAEDSEI